MKFTLLTLAGVGVTAWIAARWLKIPFQNAPTLFQQRDKTFGKAIPRYRITQPGDRRRLRLWNERIVVRRKSA